MSTGVIIALIVIVIVAVVVVVTALLRARARGGIRDGGSLRRRFGPEYDRTVARHDGDERAAAREPAQRVKRYGSLERPPLRSEERQRMGVEGRDGTEELREAMVEARGCSTSWWRRARARGGVLTPLVRLVLLMPICRGRSPGVM